MSGEKWSQRPAADPLVGDEITLVAQSGISKQTTPNAYVTLASGVIVPAAVAEAALYTDAQVAAAIVTTEAYTDSKFPVPNAQLADMAEATVKGRAAGAGTGDPQDLTQAQLTALVNSFTDVLPGAVPASGGGTANFLRADGNWATPPGTGEQCFDVTEFGAIGDGVTDDTAAIQAAIDAAAASGGVVCFPEGVYLVSGALQDPSGANAQLVLPSIALASTQITVELRGPFPPSTDFCVVGTTPTPTSGAVILSSLTTGSGGHCIGVRGPTGSFSNLTVVVRNLTIRMPSNPTHSALGLEYAACSLVDEVVVDPGSYVVPTLVEPTTSTSYGIKFPRINNGAKTSIGTVNVIGFYNGYLGGEHLTAQELNAWGCKNALVVPAGFHAISIQRLMVIWSEIGILGIGGESYISVEEMDIEHAVAGWMVPVNDISDTSNFLNGEVHWHVVTAGTGVAYNFSKDGGEGLNTTRVGTPLPALVVDTSSTNTNILAADAGTYVRFTANGAKTITVRPNATEALPDDGEWHMRNVGTGDLTIVAGVGVTINAPVGGSLVVAPNGTVTLKRAAINVFDLFGVTV